MGWKVACGPRVTCPVPLTMDVRPDALVQIMVQGLVRTGLPRAVWNAVMVRATAAWQPTAHGGSPRLHTLDLVAPDTST